MDKIKTREIKGYSENFENFYFTNRAIELDVGDGKGGIEKVVIADKEGNAEALDKLRQDFFPLKNIYVSSTKTELKGRSKIANRIFGTTVVHSGAIIVNSKIKYNFCTLQSIGSLYRIFDRVRLAEIEEVK